MARKPIWSRACCTSPPPHSHSALCTSHTHLLTISLCTPTFSQSYHLTIRASTFSLPIFHTPSDTNSLIFSPYHSAQSLSHNLTLSLFSPITQCQYQYVHFSLFSAQPPSLNLRPSHLYMQHPPSHSLHNPPSQIFSLPSLCKCSRVRSSPGPQTLPPPFTVPT